MECPLGKYSQFEYFSLKSIYQKLYQPVFALGI